MTDAVPQSERNIQLVDFMGRSLRSVDGTTGNRTVAGLTAPFRIRVAKGRQHTAQHVVPGFGSLNSTNAPNSVQTELQVALSRDFRHSRRPFNRPGLFRRPDHPVLTPQLS